MCGIVGLFLKDLNLVPKLGEMLSDMLITMTDRGPDSAGIAIYGAPKKGRIKITVQSPKAASDFDGLKGALAKVGISVFVTVKSSHAVIETDAEAAAIRTFMAAH